MLDIEPYRMLCFGCLDQAKDSYTTPGALSLERTLGTQNRTQIDHKVTPFRKEKDGRIPESDFASLLMIAAPKKR
jgi:hypothetical protein